MKNISRYLPLHFVLLLILGILVQFYLKVWLFGFTSLFLTLLVFTLLTTFSNVKFVRTIFAFLLFFIIGISCIYVNNLQNYTNYYQNHITENTIAVFKIEKVLKSGFYNHKYQVEVTQINEIKTRGSLLLNVRKDSTVSPLTIASTILLKPIFVEVNEALNPNQFNYKQYLEKQGIYTQVFVTDSEYLQLSEPQFSISGTAAAIRNNIQHSLQKHHFTKDELSVINALLLGQRKDISKELVANYSNAGAMHILAVSGLHVGVILYLLTLLFKPIQRLKYGKVINAVLIVLLLWLFACLAGLSASVVRAVTMFTFLTIGMALNGKSNAIFSLITSMLFLLICKPMFLFDVGFQLSYCAVFAIIWLQPKLQLIWKPKFWGIRFFWNLFTVSIAAQIGVLPLSIYYFHQFPGLFLVSNLIIIPFLMAILIGGILVILLSLLNILPQFLATGYAGVISLLNSFVGWVSNQEAFLFQEIYFSFVFMLLSYVVLIFGALFFMKTTLLRFAFFIGSVALLQSLFLLNFLENDGTTSFIVFHKSRETIVGKRVGVTLEMQHSLDSLKLKEDYSLKPYLIAKKIKKLTTVNFHNFIKFNNTHILLVDSLGVYALRNMVNPIVILQFSPKINLSRLIKTIKPSQIIADGSNYTSSVSSWRSIAKNAKIPFYSTRERGAFILSK